MSKILHSFPKNSLEEVRSIVTEFKGKKYIDMRVYYKAEDGSYRPTKKGLTLSPELVPELQEAMRVCMETMDETA